MINRFYTQERQPNSGWDPTKKIVRADRWRILGLGIFMEGMFLVPFGGMLVLPLGVIAGTLMYCDHDWDDVLEAVSAPLPPRYESPRLKPKNPLPEVTDLAGETALT